MSSVAAVQLRSTRVGPTAEPTRAVGADGAEVSLTAAGISITDRFQRSPVGALSLMVTDVPETAVTAACRCTHMVSPLDARYSSTFVWFAPTVRVIALS